MNETPPKKYGPTPAALTQSHDPRSSGGLKTNQALDLRSLGLFDSPTDPQIDLITALVSKTLGFPTVFFSRPGANQKWFKLFFNIKVWNRDEETDLPDQVYEKENFLLIPNTLIEARFASNPLVTNAPHIRSYAERVVRSPSGLLLGSLCCIDYRPRDFEQHELDCLNMFASLIEAKFQSRIAGEFVDLIQDQTPHQDLDILIDNDIFKVRCAALLESHPEKRFTCIHISMPEERTVARTFGHEVHKDLISEIVRRVKLGLRDRGYIVGAGAYTGLVAFATSAGPSDRNTGVAADLVNAIGQRIQTSTVIVSTPVLVGLAPLPEQDSPLEAGFLNAMTATETVTSLVAGTRAVFFSEGMDRIAERRRQVAHALPLALAHDTLTLSYQPKIRLSDSRVKGAEALLRWHDRRLGHVSPLDVISTARDTGLLPEVEHWVLRTACAQIRAWHIKGYELGPVSVNLTTETLQREGFVELIASLIQEFELPRHSLEFEILESSIIDQMNIMVDRLRCLKDLGVQISLDDFGTGHSSLSYLHQLPIDTLKIDRSFVTDIVTDTQKGVLVRQIIEIGTNLRKNVVAEGVENIGQYLILRSYQCDMIQGHYFSRPLNTEDFTSLLRDRAGIIPPRDLTDLLTA
ncbi:MAG: EAL domain-containing protein [Alphaproteobacteria bacterium]|nr:EAL domain-containing protein [Alphaproteobacteria bacterium]